MATALPSPHVLSTFAMLLIAVWCALCGGTLYAFPAFEVELKSHCGYTGQELGSVYGAGQLGVGAGIVPGILYDRFGPRVALFYATMPVAVGGLAITAFLRASSCPHYYGFAIFYFLLTHGTTALFHVGLFTSLRNTPKERRGFVAGLVTGCCGLSAAFWTKAYAVVFGLDIEQYFQWSSIIFVGTILVSIVVLPLFAQPLSTTNKDYHLMTVDSSRPFPDQESSSTFTQILQDPDLWLYISTFALVQAACSGVFVSELSLMTGSFGMPQETQLMWVSMFSYCNCGGRFLAGCLMDAFEPRGVPRVAHSIAFPLLLLSATGTLWCASDSLAHAALPYAIVAAGLAYGIGWAGMPSFMASRFGTANIGFCFNLNASIMCCMGALVSITVGGLYDSANLGVDGTQCIGVECWRGPYLLGTCLGAVGLTAGVVLTWRAMRRQGR